MLVLSNSSGKLDINLENVKEGGKALVFLLEDRGLTLEEEKNFTVLGTYTTVGNMASVLVMNPVHEEAIRGLFDGEELLSIINNKVNETTVIEEDSNCSTFNIQIKFNLSFNLDSSGKVTNDLLKFYLKDGGKTVQIPYIIINNRTFEVEVKAGQDLQIKILFKT